MIFKRMSAPKPAIRRVLVTGGGGFIGSHTAVELIERGYEVVVVDNHSTSSPRSLDRIAELTGVRPILHSIDIRDRAALSAVFAAHDIDAVIHFAAKKAVGESTQIPLEYFDINVGGTSSLLAAMKEHGVRKLVFSSSCSIYGDTDVVPLTENSPAAPANPYAWTKLTCEQMIAQACTYDPGFQAISLRYFNPVGAHPSGRLGEDPRGPIHNVMPYLMQVAIGRRNELTVFGDDYPTSDGTCVRDYVHVVDIANGHIDALDQFGVARELQIVNLGTGTGTSVLELHDAFAEACGRDVPYVIAGRRPGDVPKLVADTTKANSEWGWKAQFGLHDMCWHAWNFQAHNPNGYGD